MSWFLIPRGVGGGESRQKYIMDLLKELELTREKYRKARNQKDKPMMELWEKFGKSLKRQLDKRMKGDWSE